MRSSPSPLAVFTGEVLPRLTVEAVYADFDFRRRDGRYWRGTCPFSPSPAADSFVLDTQTLRWSCFAHCHRGGQSPLAYLNGGRFPRPGSGELGRALSKAAELSAVAVAELPAITSDEEYDAAHQDRVVSLLEAFSLCTCLALSGEGAARKAADLLVARGFDRTDLPDLSIGFYPGRVAIREMLQEAGFTVQEIDASELAADPRLEGRLIGPIRDRYGRIASFWARRPESRAGRFLFKGRWKERVGLFGLDAALRADSRATPNLLIVEPILDAILLQAKGFASVAAIGGRLQDLTRKRWRAVSNSAVGQVTLVLGPSTLESESTPDVLRRVFGDDLGRVFMVQSTPDEDRSNLPARVQREGIEATKAWIEAHSVHAYRGMADAILTRHRSGTGWTGAGRHAAWKEAIEFCAHAGGQNHQALEEHFVPRIVSGLDRTWDTFEPLSHVGTNASSCPPTSSRQSEICRLHGCSVTTCFCFD